MGTTQIIKTLMECKKGQWDHYPQVEMQEVAQMVAWIKEHPNIDDLASVVKPKLNMGPTLSDHYRRMTVSGDSEGVSCRFEYNQQWADNCTWDLTIFQPDQPFLSSKKVPDIVMFLKAFVLLSWGHCKPWHPKSPRNATQCAPPILAACEGQGTKWLQEESPIDWGHWRWYDWIRKNMAERIGKELLSETDLWLFLSTSILRGLRTCVFDKPQRTVEIWHVFFYVYIGNYILRLLIWPHFENHKGRR